MSLHTGNSVVANVLMRFPVLIPVAVAVGVASVAPETVEPPKPIPITAAVVEPMCITTTNPKTGRVVVSQNPKFVGPMPKKACTPIKKSGGG